MFTNEDLEYLKSKGLSREILESQLKRFKTGFPYLKVFRPATLGDGIKKVDENDISYFDNIWQQYLNNNVKIVKFVPASGAASRMFKSLYEFLDLDESNLFRETDLKFFGEIKKFAFFDKLEDKCKEREGKSVADLLKEGRYKSIVMNLLNAKGLNYGNLPKGLLLFHKYAEHARTAFEEHFVEGALYAKNSKGEVNLHFTVSEEHKNLFKELCSKVTPSYAYHYGAKFNVSFSVQKPSTDTIAVDKDNNIFRKDGELVFRPGGHGALIENLNDIDADVIFIKNIDNVVPDAYKRETVLYKKVLAGILVSIQKQIFSYLTDLQDEQIQQNKIKEIEDFCQEKLFIFNPELKKYTSAQKIEYLKRKLNRPLRVCGMVKNEGEPGGGPFLCQNQDGTRSLQILESSQFDKNNDTQREIMKNSTHFNPVDLVCGVKDFRGNRFDLTKYVDENTGFISLKSKDGREMKALELPGLWNGAMSDWNTIFVEVPIETFNPVKVVNDLLRKEHQFG